MSYSLKMRFTQCSGYKYEFGASEMKARCGNIYNSQGALVGKISYNGRIWDARGEPVE